MPRQPLPAIVPEVTVVVPMHNEIENLPGTLERIASAAEDTGHTFEVVAVDDGSTDTTLNRLRTMAEADSRLRVESYPVNRGRGYALRRGFAAARGRIIVTIDADLSYSPEHIGLMLRILEEQPEVDFVVGSPYAEGGGTVHVPKGRLWISRWGNRILGMAMPGGLTAVTGILRAYRRQVLDVLDLESNDKAIHLEIVSKALAAGFTPLEMPAVLTGRRRGKSKFLLRATVASHLIFSFYEKPVMLFGVIGALILGLGLGSGARLIYMWQAGTLNPDRPLIPLTVILLVAGLQIILFGFLGSQIVQVRRELYRTQKTIKTLVNSVDAISITGRLSDDDRADAVADTPPEPVERTQGIPQHSRVS
jgi:glycosyltransferase involved in cell wall biosynthesis